MKKTRLFIGIPINKGIIEMFHPLKKKYCHNEGIRWLTDNNLHITTCFLGNIEYNKINDIILQLEKLLSNVVRFNLVFDCFQLSPKRNPYMIWAKFNKDISFTELSISLRRLFKIELNKINNPVPHITLARFNKKIRIDEIIFPQNFPRFEIKVKKIVLYKSILKSSGAEYFQIKDFNTKNS
ncbi:MAG: RNA 2',3'-cyclic phosphodiesterase [Bacteroidetes bacterium]|nr:MAG: RNA 2',3'-cyclic phosphodiesterase [Bacteroidota bacterium]